jgi:hypothetical protein
VLGSGVAIVIMRVEGDGPSNRNAKNAIQDGQGVAWLTVPRQLDTPTTFPTEAPFSPALIMKSATSAREMEKPKRGRWSSCTRY